MTLRISQNENVIEKNFTVTVKSPEDSIEELLQEKNNLLSSIENELSIYPSWISSVLTNKMQLSSYESSLDDFSSQLSDLNNESDELIPLAQEVFSFTYFEGLVSEQYQLLELEDSASSISPEIVLSLEDTAAFTNEDHTDAILGWQQTNVLTKMETQVLALEKSDGERDELLHYYSLDITPIPREKSYLIMKVTGSTPLFENPDEATLIDGHYAFELIPQEKNVIEFYTNQPSSLSAYVSPSISSLVVGDLIDTSCNFNNFCEEDLGETYQTCRSDCKPVGLTFTYLAIALFLLLLLYTFFASMVQVLL